MIPSGCQGNNRLSGQNPGRHHTRRQIALRGAVGAELSIAIVSPSHGPGARPFEHDVIARAAVVVGHKIIGLPVVGHRHGLTVREVGEATRGGRRKRGQPHQSQLRPHGRGEVEGEIHRRSRRIEITSQRQRNRRRAGKRGI